MRLLLVLLTFTLYSCSTSKSVLICGDHECINKEEAKLFFMKRKQLTEKQFDLIGYFVRLVEPKIRE